jgi:hypothetical protein
MKKILLLLTVVIGIVYVGSKTAANAQNIVKRRVKALDEI